MSPHIAPTPEPTVTALPTTVVPGLTTGRGLDEVLTKKKLSERLHVTIRTIENWQRRGILQYCKIGKIVLFVWGDVLESLRHFRVSRRTVR